jgi:hypothetical protein
MASVIVLVVASTNLALAQSDVGQDRSLEPLVVLPGAIDVQSDFDGGRHDVTFGLTTSYPATETLCELNHELVERGFSGQSWDAFNPENPTSLFRGWDQYLDGTGDVPVRVFSWSAQWKNANGDFISYGFTYRQPTVVTGAIGEKLSKPPDQGLTSLRVQGMFLTKERFDSEMDTLKLIKAHLDDDA